MTAPDPATTGGLRAAVEALANAWDMIASRRRWEDRPNGARQWQDRADDLRRALAAHAEDAAPCPECGHAPHMAGWCTNDTHPACDCNEDSDAPAGGVDAIAAVLDVHRWKTMGVSSVECECGEVVHGDDSLTQFPADEAFRLHVAAAIVAARSARDA